MTAMPVNFSDWWPATWPTSSYQPAGHHPIHVTLVILSWFHHNKRELSMKIRTSIFKIHYDDDVILIRLVGARLNLHVRSWCYDITNNLKILKVSGCIVSNPILSCSKGAAEPAQCCQSWCTETGYRGSRNIIEVTIHMSLIMYIFIEIYVNTSLYT